MSDGDVGAAVPRFEDKPLLRGRGKFIDDLRAHGALAACFVRSPFAHAAIRSVALAPRRSPNSRPHEGWYAAGRRLAAKSTFGR